MTHYETITARLLSQLWDSFPADARAWVTTAVIATAGIVVLNAIYEFFRTEWPESYTSLDNRIDHQYKKNPIRTIVGFRGLPVAMIVFFISEMLDRSNGYVLPGAIGMLALYLAVTSVRAIVDVVRPPRHPNFKFVILHHVGQVFIVCVFGWLGLVAHDLWGLVIPSGEELAIALLAGSFASIMAIWTRNWLAASKLPFTELVAALRIDIGEPALSHAYIQSQYHDPSNHLGRLVESILLAEAQQRPSWFRKLENLAGRLGFSGTFGVAQVSSDRPISDFESIDILIHQLLEKASFAFEEADFHDAAIRQLLLSHNPDPDHVESIITYFYGLRSYNLYP